MKKFYNPVVYFESLKGATDVAKSLGALLRGF